MSLQAERAAHDKLAVSKRSLEERHAAKTEVCKKLEERATAKAAACKQLAQQLAEAERERNSLAAQLAALQVPLRSACHGVSSKCF